MENQADISIATPPSTDQNLNINLIGPIVSIDWSTVCDSRALVKTKEGLTCGNVVDEYEDSFVLINFGVSSWHEYLIPKSTVEGYDGKLLSLNIAREILTSYAY
ncbi:MAG: hypothetical protein WA941_15735 [Nitrososphaeraceae archaeon]